MSGRIYTHQSTRGKATYKIVNLDICFILSRSKYNISLQVQLTTKKGEGGECFGSWPLRAATLHISQVPSRKALPGSCGIGGFGRGLRTGDFVRCLMPGDRDDSGVARGGFRPTFFAATHPPSSENLKSAFGGIYNIFKNLSTVELSSKIHFTSADICARIN